MIVCFNCSLQTKQLLDSLVQTGQYGGYAEVIEAGLHNLSVLHERISEDGILVLDRNPVATARGANNKGGEAANPVQIPFLSAERVPQLFRATALAIQPPLSLPEFPPDGQSHTGEIPINEWIFGQFNRLLPLKANVRALANILSEVKGPLDPELTGRRIAQSAATLGEYLRNLDQAEGLARDGAFATAFPSLEANSAKSQLRYANQFVASISRHNRVSGLLHEYKFLSSVLLKDRQAIILTRPAWEFARLENPILDEAGGHPDRFTQRELSYLTNHILNHVPAEAFAFSYILRLVADGHTTPDALDKELEPLIPQQRLPDLSLAFLSTQRSGAVSRMSDLNLLERTRDGIRVNYRLTQRGAEFLAQAEIGPSTTGAKRA